MKVKTIIHQDILQFDKLTEAFYNKVPDDDIIDEHYYSSSFGFARQSAIPNYHQVGNDKTMVNLEIVTVFCVTFIYNETKAGENSQPTKSKVEKA